MTIDPLIAFLYRPAVAMTPNAAGATWTHTLQPGEILDVVVPAAGSCYYNVVNTTNNAVIATATIGASTTQTLGPYNVPAALTLKHQGPSLGLNIARLND